MSISNKHRVKKHFWWWNYITRIAQHPMIKIREDLDTTCEHCCSRGDHESDFIVVTNHQSDLPVRAATRVKIQLKRGMLNFNKHYLSYHKRPTTGVINKLKSDCSPTRWRLYSSGMINLYIDLCGWWSYQDWPAYNLCLTFQFPFHPHFIRISLHWRLTRHFYRSNQHSFKNVCGYCYDPTEMNDCVPWRDTYGSKNSVFHLYVYIQLMKIFLGLQWNMISQSLH